MAKGDDRVQNGFGPQGGWVTIGVAALGILGTLGSGAIGYQSGALSVNKDYAQMAMRNLQDETTSPELRSWSVNVLNELAPIPLDEELRDQLIVNRFVVPNPSKEIKSPCRDIRAEIKTETEQAGARPSNEEIFVAYFTAYEECRFRHANLVQWLEDYREGLDAVQPNGLQDKSKP